MKARRSSPLFAALAMLLVSANQAAAVEINGKVASSTPDYATIVTESELLPVPGDKVEIFFKIPGGDDEISVATAHVVEIVSDSINVQIDKASGSVAKDQLARITSEKPRKRGAQPSGPPVFQTPPSTPATAKTPPVSRSTAPPAPEPPSDSEAAERSFQEGSARQSAGDLDGAIVSYTNAIRLNPQDSRAYFNRALSYLYKGAKGAGFYDQLIADANKAIELGTPNLADAYSLRGTGWAGKGNFDKAIADHTRAIKLNPNHALAYNNRANDKLRQGDLDGALADCNKSIALDPSSPLPYYNRGYVYSKRGNLKLAIADWEKAIQMQPAYRAELEPLIQKLGGNLESQKSAAPEWTDLVNPSKRLVGTWQGGRHRTQYFADGTFVTDPHLVPSPPRSQWRVEGDRLIEHFPGAGVTITSRILSITDRELVTSDEQGRTFRKTRLK